MKFTLFTAVLFSVWMNAADGDEPPPSFCCLTVTNTRIPVEYIEDYEIQEPTGVCAIRAVRFLTRKNRYICSNPDDRWAIRAINDVNRRKNIEPYNKPIMCNTSTSNMIPTTTTTTTHETHETPVNGLEISITTTQQTSVSKEKPESSSRATTTYGRAAPPTETTHETPRPPSTIRIMTALTNSPSTEHHVFTTTATTTTAKMISTTVTTITTTQTETETSTRETKSISATANKASSDVDGRSSFTVIT
ncbi:hypothetical protein ABG768_012501 [Culter alburnus]|uniref:Chemokine interleukin-8-like domain-containing protein n=1 Tax=Culter alburnus TaxID=194366 RepID=A0AAW2AZ82_CULAL